MLGKEGEGKIKKIFLENLLHRSLPSSKAKGKIMADFLMLPKKQKVKNLRFSCLGYRQIIDLFLTAAANNSIK